MSSCHCSEIKKLGSQIETLRGLIGNLAEVQQNKVQITLNRRDAMSNWPNAFICDTDATDTLSQLGTEAESAFSSVSAKIIAKKSELETRKSELEEDDKAYHEEEAAKLAAQLTKALSAGAKAGAVCGIAPH